MDRGEDIRPAGEAVLIIIPPAIGHPDRFAHLGAASLVAFLWAHGVPARTVNLSAALYARDRLFYRRLYDAGSLERFWPHGAWGFSAAYVDEALAGARDPALAEALQRFSDRAVAAIVRARPPLVGISVLQSNVIAAAAIGTRLAEAGIPVICGGPAGTDDAIAVRLLRGSCDVVVRGEGERALLRFARQVVRGTPLRSGTVIDGTPVSDLDRLPIPDLGPGALDAIPVAASRGCVNRCRFCEEAAYWRRIRRRSPAVVAAEIAHQVRRHGARRVHFNDSLINHDPAWLGELCGLLAAGSPGLAWDAYARPAGLDRRLLAAMGRAGCVEIHFGVEHFSQRVADALGKREDVREAAAVVRRAVRAGIRAKLLLIEGVPGETPRDHRANLDAARRLLETGQSAVDLSVNPLVITPQSIFGRSPARYGIRLIPGGDGDADRAEFDEGPDRATALEWTARIRALREGSVGGTAVRAVAEHLRERLP
ncbi:MAG: radical SAM protein [Deltaproteobacteria bacterium]|nr:radical SAM protein [Deltaproteobacteria bacterium]